MAIEKSYANSDFVVLSSMIIIGDENPKNPIVIDNPKVITEVYNLTINDTYKSLINTAEVELPKGSVFKQDIIKGIASDGEDATNIVESDSNDDRVYVSQQTDGVIVEKTTTQSIVNKDSIKVGQRISIRLGYNGKLKTMFEGYIDAIGHNETVVLRCENMARKLKTIQAPRINIPKSKGYVNDIMGEKYGLLKGTGFSLHPETVKNNINVGSIMITDDFTVADVLTSWSKIKVYAHLKYYNRDNNGMPKIAILRPYSSANRAKGVKPLDSAYLVKYSYHVAQNGVNLMKSDPMFLAVQGSGLASDGKFISLYLRKNPSYNPNDRYSKKYQVVNASQRDKKAEKKKVVGSKNKGKPLNSKNNPQPNVGLGTKIDMTSYTIIPYVSKTRDITIDKLRDECITWFESYQENGIEGTVTIFGDYGLQSGVLINLVDEINSEKNGIYIVDEVTTQFGIGGYRQILKIPYRVKKDE